MKTSRVLISIIVLAIAVTIYYTLSSGSSDQDYAAAIIQSRRDKDDYMKNSDESPFTEKAVFTGLKYFEPDFRYRVSATLRPVENKKVVVLTTSTGEENHYLEYAWAEFELDGVQNRLLILEVMAMGPTRGSLFLGFADETSAKETYGAGRYLDIKKVPGAGNLTLDFNKAYNPYCAYTDNYSCPFPPRENFLKIAILAGEKNYH